MYKWTFEQAKKLGILVDGKEYLIIQDYRASEVLMWNLDPAFGDDSRPPYGVSDEAIVIDVNSLI